MGVCMIVLDSAATSTLVIHLQLVESFQPSTHWSSYITPMMETDFNPHLEEAIRRLRETIDLLAPIVETPTPDGTPSCSDLFGFHPPVIDNRNKPWTSGDPLGMRKFIESMSTQMTLLEAVSSYVFE